MCLGFKLSLESGFVLLQVNTVWNWLETFLLYSVNSQLGRTFIENLVLCVMLGI